MHQHFLMTREGRTSIAQTPAAQTINQIGPSLRRCQSLKRVTLTGKRACALKAFTNSQRQEKGRSELISGIPPRLHRHLITRTRHGSILSSFSPVPSCLLFLTLSHLELWCSFNPSASRFAHLTLCALQPHTITRHSRKKRMFYASRKVAMVDKVSGGDTEAEARGRCSQCKGKQPGRHPDMFHPGNTSREAYRTKR